MYLVIGIATFVFLTLALGVAAVVVYIDACYPLQQALRTHASTGSARGEPNLDELLQAISDLRD